VWETDGEESHSRLPLRREREKKKGNAREANLPSFLSAVDFDGSLSNALSVSPSVNCFMFRLVFFSFDTFLCLRAMRCPFTR
jgi:hypothetical protein